VPSQSTLLVAVVVETNEAAAVGDATARAITYQMRAKDAYYYADSSWQPPFVGGYKFQVEPGVLNLDANEAFFFLATAVTPAMEEKTIGQGSQYAWTVRDAKAIRLTEGRAISCTCRPTSRSKTSGRSSSMTTRRARCCDRPAISERR
jgi:hypothetical protein